MYYLNLYFLHQTGVVDAYFSLVKQRKRSKRLNCCLCFFWSQREVREKILSILTDPLFYFIVRFYFSDVLCFPSNEGKVKLSNIKHTHIVNYGGNFLKKNIITVIGSIFGLIFIYSFYLKKVNLCISVLFRVRYTRK